MSSLCVLPSGGARTVPCACERRPCFALRCSALPSSPLPSALPAPLAPARFARAVVKEALRCGALHSSFVLCSARLSARDVAAPVVAASYPVATARKQCLRCAALPCHALLSAPFCPTQLLGGLLPRYGLQNLQPMRENKLGGAIPCPAVLCFAFLSARAVNLCSHFFRLACFKLCQVVASELGPVVAKPFKHGRMHKRILYIRHVQYFGNDRH